MSLKSQKSCRSTAMGYRGLSRYWFLCHICEIAIEIAGIKDQKKKEDMYTLLGLRVPAISIEEGLLRKVLITKGERSIVCAGKSGR
jgi:hypothetical protein